MKIPSMPKFLRTIREKSVYNFQSRSKLLRTIRGKKSYDLQERSELVRDYRNGNFPDSDTITPEAASELEIYSSEEQIAQVKVIMPINQEGSGDVYPPGGGVNTIKTLEDGTYSGLNIKNNSDGTITISGILDRDYLRLSYISTLDQDGVHTILATAPNQYVYAQVAVTNKETGNISYINTARSNKTFIVDSSINTYRVYVRTTGMETWSSESRTFTLGFLAAKGEVTDFSPYSNIRNLIPYKELSIRRTGEDESDSTTYHYELPEPTYEGTIDVNKGVLTRNYWYDNLSSQTPGIIASGSAGYAYNYSRISRVSIDEHSISNVFRYRPIYTTNEYYGQFINLSSNTCRIRYGEERSVSNWMSYINSITNELQCVYRIAPEATKTSSFNVSLKKGYNKLTVDSGAKLLVSYSGTKAEDNNED